MLGAKEKIKRIYGTLPQLNCGLCGFNSCGQFAKAVAEGRASPFSCRQDPWAGYRIGEIMGMRAPIFGYQHRMYQPIYTQRTGQLSSLTLLRRELGALSTRIEGILDRLENLGERKVPP